MLKFPLKIIWLIVVACLFFPFNLLFYGWKRTLCSLIHHQIMGYRPYRPDIRDPGNKKCSYCGLKYRDGECLADIMGT